MVLAFAEGNSIQLVPDGTILIHIALILLMIWVLNRTFFRPINRVLEARSRSQGGRSSEAENTLRIVAEKNQQYETTIRQARLEGYNLIEAERTAALAERESKIGAIKSETEAMSEREKAALRAQADEARRQIAADAEKMADKISANILKSA